MAAASRRGVGQVRSSRREQSGGTSSSHGSASKRGHGLPSVSGESSSADQEEAGHWRRVAEEEPLGGLRGQPWERGGLRGGGALPAKKAVRASLRASATGRQQGGRLKKAAQPKDSPAGNLPEWGEGDQGSGWESPDTGDATKQLPGAGRGVAREASAWPLALQGLITPRSCASLRTWGRKDPPSEGKSNSSWRPPRRPGASAGALQKPSRARSGRAFPRRRCRGEGSGEGRLRGWRRWWRQDWCRRESPAAPEHRAEGSGRVEAKCPEGRRPPRAVPWQDEGGRASLVLPGRSAHLCAAALGGGRVPVGRLPSRAPAAAGCPEFLPAAAEEPVGGFHRAVPVPHLRAGAGAGRRRRRWGSPGLVPGALQPGARLPAPAASRQRLAASERRGRAGWPRQSPVQGAERGLGAKAAPRQAAGAGSGGSQPEGRLRLGSRRRRSRGGRGGPARLQSHRALQLVDPLWRREAEDPAHAGEEGVFPGQRRQPVRCDQSRQAPPVFPDSHQRWVDLLQLLPPH